MPSLPVSSMVSAALLSKHFMATAVEIETAEVRLQSVCPPALLEDARALAERTSATSGASYKDTLVKVTKALIETGKLPRG